MFVRIPVSFLFIFVLVLNWNNLFMLTESFAAPSHVPKLGFYSVFFIGASSSHKNIFVNFGNTKENFIVILFVIY